MPAAVFLLLGLAFEAGMCSLTSDLQKFQDVVAFEDFAAPFLNTYQESPEFAGSADFLVSSEFNAILDELVASVYFEEYASLLADHGVPVWQWLERLRAMTHQPPFPVPNPLQAKRVSTDFMPFVYNALPYFILTDIIDVHFYLSRTSISFMALLDLLKSEEYQNTLAFLTESPQFQALVNALYEYGIDPGQIYSYLAKELKMAYDYDS